MSKSPPPEPVENTVDEPKMHARLRAMAAVHLKAATIALSDAHGLHGILEKLGASDAGSSKRTEAIAEARAALAKLEKWSSAQPTPEPVDPTESWFGRRPPAVDPGAHLDGPRWHARGRR